MIRMDCDLLVIGGGINGVGIARDAVGRGLSVVLLEQDDLAAHTSSASSKLIHGGLRYLETYQFGLVRKALLEREVLLRIAPHIVTPLAFVMPHEPSLRPAWMLRLGLFLYDHLATRQLLPGSSTLDLTQHPAGLALHSRYRKGFKYFDARVDDARLVVLNAIDAKERGAQIFTRSRCVSLTPEQGQWRAQIDSNLALASDAPAAVWTVDAKCVVNAAGAWVDQLHSQTSAQPTQPPQSHLRLIKGSHIIVKRLFEHDHAYIFQHHDGRIVFAIPYENEFSLIGTTDVEFHGELQDMHISEAEVDYLCALSNHFFQRSISPADVLFSYAGVRALYDDGRQDAKSIARDYHLSLETHIAPIVHVYGGKITTYRKLALDVMDLLKGIFPQLGPAWTAALCLPGGDLARIGDAQADLGRLQFLSSCREKYHFVPDHVLQRWLAHYGTRIQHLLRDCHQLADLGKEISANLFECELHYLCEVEFAVTAEDVLWRRSKLGLRMGQQEVLAVEKWLVQYRSSRKNKTA